MLSIYVRRGLAAGMAGAATAIVVLLAFGEQSISKAIALEEAGHHGAAEEPLVSRAGQLVGGSLGVAIVGLVLGAVFATVFAKVRHRLPGRTDWHRALVLGAAGFVAVQLVPFLKYPANPPAVGDPETITQRTLSYTLLVAFSVVSLWLAWRVGLALRERGRPEPQPMVLGVLLWVGLAVAAWLAFPANPDEIAAPANLIWRFRLASLAGQASFWMVTAAVFGWLLLPATQREPSSVLAAKTVR